MKKICAVYQIVNNQNGKIYIGASRDIKNRWRMHKLDLKKREHINAFMQQDFETYGIEAFDFFVLEECSIDELDEKEKYYIETLQSRELFGGYNYTDGGQGVPGKIFSDVTREKISKALMGNNNGHFAKWTEERKESVRGENNAWFGKHPTEETRKKISEAGMGRVQSPSTREKISAGHRGKKHKDAKSIYLGVCWHALSRKWMARLKVHGKEVYGGLFESEMDAANKYNEMALLYFGESANLNTFGEQNGER